MPGQCLEKHEVKNMTQALARAGPYSALSCAALIGKISLLMALPVLLCRLGSFEAKATQGNGRSRQQPRLLTEAVEEKVNLVNV